MKKADNFNPGNWLVENKLTSQSKLNEASINSKGELEDFKDDNETFINSKGELEDFESFKDDDGLEAAAKLHDLGFEIEDMTGKSSYYWILANGNHSPGMKTLEDALRFNKNRDYNKGIILKHRIHDGSDNYDKDETIEIPQDY